MSEASPAGPLRRALVAALAVLALVGLGSLIFWLARNSPYRGHLATMSPGVVVTRDGRPYSPRALEALDVRAGDEIRVPAEGNAQLHLASGGGAHLGAGAEVVIDGGSADIELRAGRVQLVPGGETMTVAVGTSRYLLSGGPVEATPAEVSALGSPVEVTSPSGARLRLAPGQSSPWPR